MMAAPVQQKQMMSTPMQQMRPSSVSSWHNDNHIQNVQVPKPMPAMQRIPNSVMGVRL
jgi:hypothetical protein